MYQPVQISLPAELLARLDSAVADRGMSRSAYLREIIEASLRAEEIRRWDEQLRAAYALQPETADELAAMDAANAAEPWGEWNPENNLDGYHL
jgi:metal-responsive CopG/Arc/MetJ family transcriptional regulator